MGYHSFVILECICNDYKKQVTVKKSGGRLNGWVQISSLQE